MITRTLLAVTALLILIGPATARPHHRKIPQRGTPIIAGQPGVRVSPSGNVITSEPALPSRDTNGRVRQRHHRMGPRMKIMR